jgi:predicted transcriptional regulator
MALLNVDIGNKLNIQSEEFVGICAAILGIRGTGKSNTDAVIVEELLGVGFPMTIVDIENEYWGLRERFEILVVGRSDKADFEVGQDQAARLAELSITRKIPIILDMSEYTQDEMYAFLLEYFTGLWEASATARQPYQIILEEAHEFIPQKQHTPLKEILTRIALRGRKRGLATVLISQRSPKVDKDVLTQAELLFLHRVVHPTDLRVYEDLIPLPPRQVDEMVGSLERGQAIVLYKHTTTVAQMRLRHTFHAGATPTLDAAPAPELRKIDAATLTELQKVLTTEKPSAAKDEPPGRIAELESVIEKQKAEIQRLCDELAAARNKVAVAPVMEVQASPEPVQPDEYLSSRQLDRRMSDQRRRFDYLMKDVMILRRAQRRMLRFMLEREDSEFSPRDLARRLDISLRTVEKVVDLEQLGLVKHNGKGPSKRYFARAMDYFEVNYPQLKAHELRDEMVAALSKKELAGR